LLRLMRAAVYNNQQLSITSSFPLFSVSFFKSPLLHESSHSSHNPRLILPFSIDHIVSFPRKIAYTYRKHPCVEQSRGTNQTECQRSSHRAVARFSQPFPTLTFLMSEISRGMLADLCDLSWRSWTKFGDAVVEMVKYFGVVRGCNSWQ